MKKMIKLYKLYVIKAAIYKAIPRCSISLVLALLWDRYLNKNVIPLSNAIVVLGVILLGMAWVNYLNLDGIRFHYLNEKLGAGKKPKRHSTKDMIDYTDEEVIPYGEFEYDEQVACRLASNLLSGFILILLSIFIAM